METVIKWIDGTAKWMTRFSLAGAAIAMLGLAVHIALEVTIRNAGIGSIVGTTEVVAGFWMILIVFLGIAGAQRTREHISVTMLTSSLTAGMAIAATATALVLTLVAFGLIGWFGFESAMHNTAIREYDASSNFPLWLARWSVPISALTICVEILASLVKIFAPRTRNEVSA